MNKEYFTDNISDETLAKLIDEALNYETTRKNKNIKLDLLKIIPAVAMVAIVVGFINILSYFSMVDEGDSGTDENAHSAITATTEEPANPTETATEEEVIDKYAHVRFGETRDILLLDVEWHTYDTYLQSIEDMTNANPEIKEDERYIDILEENLKLISENKQYVAKTINGKSTASLSVTLEDGGDISDQLDSDGYYIFNIYPYMPSITYIDENGKIQVELFSDVSDSTAISKKWYNTIIEEQIMPFCSDLLEKGLLTQEMYDYYTTLDPLDYYADLYFGHLLEPADPYAHVRFGETRDILLLDVEWHTYDTYLQSIEDFKSQNKEYSEEDWYKAGIIRMENNLESMSENKYRETKTINGKDDIGYFGVTSEQEIMDISDYVDENGYYIKQVYPYMPYVQYADENGETQTKIFDEGEYYGSVLGLAGSKRWYDLMMEEQIMPFCNDLLEKGLLTQEMYEYYTTLDPLDHYADLYFGHLK